MNTVVLARSAADAANLSDSFHANPEPPNTAESESVKSTPTCLFATLKNGAAIIGTGRLRKLRPSAITRRW
jgi:hypothetical protein